jgi:hypothetical protein
MMVVMLVDMKDSLMVERWGQSMADKWVDEMAGL